MLGRIGDAGCLAGKDLKRSRWTEHLRTKYFGQKLMDSLIKNPSRTLQKRDTGQLNNPVIKRLN